ncbi:MAG TPA: hypothetical protein VLA93_00685 [Pyrinomonadaceae bacterium]|nr:hypothetical protein [Pyrinomonadaceae bacterium]
MPSRRSFLGGLVASAALPGLRNPGLAGLQKATGSIERESLVRRHNPINTRIDPLAALSLGNGRFAFTADVTGLQTLAQEYESTMPLCTISEWGWHTTPKPARLINSELRLTQYETHGRTVGYHTTSEGQTELFNWLRENPHKLHLGRVSFCRVDQPQREISSTDIKVVKQELDLWRGVLRSVFELDDKRVNVTTAVHPTSDTLAVHVQSSLLKEGRLAICFRFPYGWPGMAAADWKQPERHQTKIVERASNRLRIERVLDSDRYEVAIAWESKAKFAINDQHTLILKSEPGTPRLLFTASFSPRHVSRHVQTVSETFTSAEAHWRRFWSTGGAIELEGSADARANELERRIVLSQYLTAIQCSGTMPPQETGLTVNSWYGKFHLEMHWWHATHFALWNRLPLFERSLGWYEKILPQARELARSQGYAGVRWPKMVGPEGRDSPSPIGPLLIWQQPHPIFYAEVCYQSHPNRTTLKRYADIVFESASFMSSFAYLDKARDRFVLGPPVIPAQENHPARETWNPTLELAYWKFGLSAAQRWRERLGMGRLAEWDRVIKKLSPLPTAEGVYLAHENCPQTFTERNRDHPSFLGAFGLLAGEDVDRETMRRTLHKTMKEWQWNQTWGWDYPMTAMTAARLGEKQIAVDALLMETEKNRYLTNGHNWQRPNLPCYLPGNGGLLYAIAMMAAGWKGAPATHAPGFPDDGSWKVRWEGLNSFVARKF